MNMKVENEMALPTTKSVAVMLLEPYAGKLARTVLRGESSRKGADLLDNCDECHSGPYYTDMKMHRIGEDIEFENGWDTPTLCEVWRTAPYLFDGRAATMEEVFTVHKHGIEKKISAKEAEELAEYVNSL